MRGQNVVILNLIKFKTEDQSARNSYLIIFSKLSVSRNGWDGMDNYSMNYLCSNKQLRLRINICPQTVIPLDVGFKLVIRYLIITGEHLGNWTETKEGEYGLIGYWTKPRVDKWYGDRWSHLCPKKWLFFINLGQGLSSKVGFFLIF